AGIVLSGMIPELMNTSARGTALLHSITGAAFGLLVLWIIAEAGKFAFGKKRHVFEKPEPFEWRCKGNEIYFRLGSEVWEWNDIFCRPSDELVLSCSHLDLDPDQAGQQIVWEESGETTLRFRWNGLQTKEGEYLFDLGSPSLTGQVTAITIPRE